MEQISFTMKRNAMQHSQTECNFITPTPTDTAYSSSWGLKNLAKEFN